MKNKLLVAVCGLLAGLLVFAEDCRSSNTHGVVKVETTSTNVLIAVPWTFYTPTSAVVTNLPVDHLVWPKNLDDGDLLLLLTEQSHVDKSYQTWTLVREPAAAKGGTPGEEPASWVASKTVQTDPSDMLKAADTLADQDEEILRGVGLWLVRKNPKDSDGKWKPVYLYGQYATGPATVTYTSDSTKAKSVMVAHPCCQTLSVNDDMVWDGVAADDTLEIPNGSDAPNLALWDAKSSKWYFSMAVRSGRTLKTMKSYDISVPAGHGFWYVRRAPGKVVITFNPKP